MVIENPVTEKKQKTVLLVEDQKYNLLVLKIMLERKGFVVVPAENGFEAVQIFRENDNLDLVFMDIKMPVMDGFKAMREIKKIRPSMKVIAETACALAGDKNKIIEAGFDDYLLKPITKESLDEIIKRNLQ